MRFLQMAQSLAASAFAGNRLIAKPSTANVDNLVDNVENQCIIHSRAVETVDNFVDKCV